MKISRKSLALTPLVLAIGVAAGAVTYSPISCGCADPWQYVADGLSLNIRDSNQLNAKVIAEGLKRTLSGKVVEIKDVPFAGTMEDCALSNSPNRVIRCRWWLWEASDRIKGFDVVVSTTPDKIFRRADVYPIEHVAFDSNR